MIELMGLQYESPTEAEALREVFPLRSTFIPVSWLAWLMLFLVLQLIFSRRALWVLSLLPPLGLLLTLAAASPLWYWPRYAAAIQFLLPLYYALFRAIRRDQTAGISLRAAGSENDARIPPAHQAADPA